MGVIIQCEKIEGEIMTLQKNKCILVSTVAAIIALITTNALAEATESFGGVNINNQSGETVVIDPALSSNCETADSLTGLTLAPGATAYKGFAIKLNPDKGADDPMCHIQKDVFQGWVNFTVHPVNGPGSNFQILQQYGRSCDFFGCDLTWVNQYLEGQKTGPALNVTWKGPADNLTIIINKNQ